MRLSTPFEKGLVILHRLIPLKLVAVNVMTKGVKLTWFSIIYLAVEMTVG
jgi:hypothetical protein